jgi:hypothetical protein
MSMRLRATALLALLVGYSALAGSWVSGQSPPPALGSISGRITDEQNRPIEDVFVAAWPRYSQAGARSSFGSARTERDGAYRILDVPPGDYVVGVIVSRDTLRQSDPNVPSACVVVAPPAPWTLADEIAATGRVPPPGPPPPPPRPVGTLYADLSRPFKAPPPAPDGTTMTYGPTFYPRASTYESAGSVVVRAGEMTTGVDLRFLPIPAETVTGRVIGAGTKSGTLELRSRTGARNVVARSWIQRDGTFTILDVPYGAYRLQLSLFTPGGCDYASVESGDDLTELSVDVGPGGVANLEIPIFRGYTISGAIIFNGHAPRSTSTAIEIAPVDRPDRWPLPQGSGRGSTFMATHLGPGRYELRARPINEVETWRLERVVVGGQDVTGRPFTLSGNIEDIQIVMTDHPASVAGSIQGGTNPVAVIFPTDRAMWPDAHPLALRFISTRASRGTYFFGSVLPGDYYLAAVDEQVTAAWPSTAVLEQIAARATRLVVSTGRAYFVSLETK